MIKSRRASKLNLFLVLSLIVCAMFASVPAASATPGRQNVPRLMSYEELMQLSPAKREAYVQGLRELVVELSKVQRSNVKGLFAENDSWLETYAQNLTQWLEVLSVATPQAEAKLNTAMEEETDSNVLNPSTLPKPAAAKILDANKPVRVKPRTKAREEAALKRPKSAPKKPVEPVQVAPAAVEVVPVSRPTNTIDAADMPGVEVQKSGRSYYNRPDKPRTRLAEQVDQMSANGGIIDESNKTQLQQAQDNLRDAEDSYNNLMGMAESANRRAWEADQRGDVETGNSIRASVPRILKSAEDAKMLIPELEREVAHERAKAGNAPNSGAGVVTAPGGRQRETLKNPEPVADPQNVAIPSQRPEIGAVSAEPVNGGSCSAQQVQCTDISELSDADKKSLRARLNADSTSKLKTCNFGGNWSSYAGGRSEKGKCQAVISFCFSRGNCAMPDGPELKCKGKTNALCNPMIFGVQKDGKPFCAPAKGNMSETCAAASTDETRMPDFLKAQIPGIAEKWNQEVANFEKICGAGSTDQMASDILSVNCSACKVISSRIASLNQSVTGSCDLGEKAIPGVNPSKVPVPKTRPSNITQ